MKKNSKLLRILAGILAGIVAATFAVSIWCNFSLFTRLTDEQQQNSTLEMELKSKNELYQTVSEELETLKSEVASIEKTEALYQSYTKAEERLSVLVKKTNALPSSSELHLEHFESLKVLHEEIKDYNSNFLTPTPYSSLETEIGSFSQLSISNYTDIVGKKTVWEEQISVLQTEICEAKQALLENLDDTNVILTLEQKILSITLQVDALEKELSTIGEVPSSLDMNEELATFIEGLDQEAIKTFILKNLENSLTFTMGVPLDYSKEFLNEVAKILSSGKYPNPKDVKYYEAWNHSVICNWRSGEYPLIDLYTTYLEPMALWVKEILYSENCTETTRQTLVYSNIWMVIDLIVSDAQSGESTLLTVVQNAENIIPYSCGICDCMSSSEEFFQDTLNRLFERILNHPNCTDAVRAAIKARE